jgi:hypothetical protein
LEQTEINSHEKTNLAIFEVADNPSTDLARVTTDYKPVIRQQDRVNAVQVPDTDVFLTGVIDASTSLKLRASLTEAAGTAYPRQCIMEFKRQHSKSQHLLKKFRPNHQLQVAAEAMAVTSVSKATAVDTSGEEGEVIDEGEVINEGDAEVVNEGDCEFPFSC